MLACHDNVQARYERWLALIDMVLESSMSWNFQMNYGSAEMC